MLFSSVSTLTARPIAIAVAPALRTITARRAGVLRVPVFTAPISFRTVVLRPPFTWPAFSRRAAVWAVSIRTLSICPAFTVAVFGSAPLTIGAGMLRTTVAAMRMIFVVSRRTITLWSLGTGVDAEYGVSIGRCIGRLPFSSTGAVRIPGVILIAVRTIVATFG